MIYRISNLPGQFKTQKSFEKWVDKTRDELKERIYENRSVIYKREVEDELKGFESVKPLWSIMKALRKKSTDYDLIIFTDKNGYHRFEFRFPIAKFQFDEGVNYRKSVIEKLNTDGFRWGSACFSQDEAVSKVILDFVRKEYPFLEVDSNSVFCRASEYVPLVRSYSLGRFKEIV